MDTGVAINGIDRCHLLCVTLGWDLEGQKEISWLRGVPCVASGRNTEPVTR
jgi:hypothetical protein